MLSYKTHKTVMKKNGVDTDIRVHFSCTVTSSQNTKEALTSVKILSRLFMEKKNLIIN